MLHDRIKIITALLLVTSFLSYTFYLLADLPESNYDFQEEITKGKTIWQRKNCTACHQVYGLGGYLGPDLTNVYSLRGENYIRAFINGGNGTMPAFNLPEDEMKDLISYLKNIDKSGISDPRTFTINYDGTICQ